MDRKTDNILKKIKNNSNNIQEFKATQFAGGDSIQLQLLSTGGAYNTSYTLAPNELKTFYYQVFDATAMVPEDASYNSGTINIYVDTPPPGVEYQGISSSSISAPFANPILVVDIDAIDFENGHYWAFQMRNIDNVNHTVYTKGYVTTILVPTSTFWSYGVG